MAYDKKFRERAIAFQESGVTFSQLKATFGIDRNTFVAWAKLRDETGSVVVDRPPQERRRKIDKEKLRLAVQAVFYALKKMGITLKKDVRLC